MDKYDLEYLETCSCGIVFDVRTGIKYTDFCPFCEFKEKLINLFANFDENDEEEELPKKVSGKKINSKTKKFTESIKKSMKDQKKKQSKKVKP